MLGYLRCYYLEASYRSRSASLTNGFDSLSHPHGSGADLEVLVEGGHEARVHGWGEEVQQIVEFIEQSSLHIQTGVHDHQHTCDRGLAHQKPSTTRGVMLGTQN
jgi:hypothetical protein